MRQRAAEQRGSVIVFVAVAMQVMLLMMAFAIEVGNWYVHQHQIQNRADNAAFAAALAYGYRFPACTADDGTLGNEIVAVAKEYAGDDSVPTAVNTGVNDQANVNVVVNSKSLTDLDGSDAADPHGPCAWHLPGSPPAGESDFTSLSGGYWLDVKTQETDVASLFGGFGVSVPSIAARARIRLMDIATATNVQPFVVSDTSPNAMCAWVRFSNPSSQTFLLSPPTAPGSNIWSVDTGDVTKDGDHLSASVILSAKPSGGCPAGSPPSDSVEYQNVGYADRYPSTDNGVTIREIQVNAFPCNGQYVWFGDPVGCNISIVANVEVAGCNGVAPQPEPTVEAQLGSGPWVPLIGATPNWTGDLGTADAGTGGPPDGTLPIRIHANCAANGNDLTTQEQSVMAGNDRYEGPIKSFSMTDTSFTNNVGFAPRVEVEIVPLQSAAVTDSPVVIRGNDGDFQTNPGHFLSGAIQFAGGAIDCGTSPATTTEDAIRIGCAGPFGVPSACPGSPPATCTVTAAGNVASGGLESAYNSTWCAATNHWAEYPNIPRDDPRLVVVAVTRLGDALEGGNAGHQEQIDHFAAFYVTGWAGDNCSPDPGNDPVTAVGAIDDTYPGALWGHFVKFVRPPSTGTPGSTPCQAQTETRGVDACIATLVR